MDFILNISMKMEVIFKTDLRSSSQVVFHAGSLYNWFSVEIINSGRIVTTAIKTLLSTVKYDIVKSARIYAGQGYTEHQAQEEWNMILHVLFEEETESSASSENIHEKMIMKPMNAHPPLKRCLSKSPHRRYLKTPSCICLHKRLCNILNNMERHLILTRLLEHIILFKPFMEPL